MTPVHQDDERAGAQASRPVAKGVTLRDVAARAGVSTATVSHVVNDNPSARIGEGTRERVRQAIADLGYRPNIMAKTLSSGRSQFIGLVADAIATTPFAGEIIRGAQSEAWKRGHVLLVANTDGNSAAEESAIEMMLEHKVRGILYSTWYHREVAVPDSLVGHDVVLVNCFAADDSARSVVPDERQGGRSATEMLIEAGHRRIAFVNTTTASPARDGRLAGYEDAHRDAGLTIVDDLIFDAAPMQEGGYRVAEQILSSGATAVFCHNDRVAMGLYDYLRERGLRVPADLAVVGFDNQEVIAAHLHPPLSTVGLPHYNLGVEGVRALLDEPQAHSSLRTAVTCPPVSRHSI